MLALTAQAYGRFAKKVEVDADGCWLWTGGVDPSGYGRFHVAPGRMGYAHRVAYEWAIGQIPVGLDLDHLCRVRRCVNPLHLEAVTRQVNLMRGETLAAAHHAGVFCGHAKCKSCRRFTRGTAA